MRFALLLCAFVATLRAAVPPELELALKNFRADAPRGWSFTQTTEAEGRSMVEHCNAAKPEFDRWTLVQKDGHAPGAEDLKTYAEARSQRSRSGTAPKITDQFDLATVETVADTAESATYRCRLRPGEARDKTAPYLRAAVIVHKPTQTITSIELSNVAAFSPTIGVKIAEMSTRLTYTVPQDGRPSLPDKVITRVRGTAFFFKSLDADMTVTFSDYAWAGKKR